MTASSLGHVPGGERWSFDAEVTRVFEDMLRRSIPQYEAMRNLVADLAAAFIRPRAEELEGAFRAFPNFVDLGASRGDAAETILVRAPAARGLLVEVSEPMLEACRERFGGHPRIEIADFDLRCGYPSVRDVDVTLSVLTLQFTPIEHRLRIVRDVFRSLRPGGAFLLVEKVLGASADLDELLVELYLREKERAGYSRDEIERKRLALEGVLVPVTARWNEDLLRSAGFRDVDCVWRSLNFAGWVAIR